LRLVSPARSLLLALAVAAALPAASGEEHQDGRHTMRRLPANLGRSAIGVFHADNLVPFLAGGGAAATASFFDQDVRNSVISTDWDDAFETGAGPVWSSLFVAGMVPAYLLAGVVVALLY
jgi:hypothetical protein